MHFVSGLQYLHGLGARIGVEVENVKATGEAKVAANS
jgi:hypothetical protein